MIRTIAATAVCLAMLSTSSFAATAFGVKDPAGGADKMTIDNNGYLNIGVSGATVLPPVRPFQLVGAPGVATQMLILSGDTTSTTAYGGGQILLGHNNANKSLPKKNDRLGMLYFVSQDMNTTGGAILRSGGAFAAFADEDWVSGQTGTTAARSGMSFSWMTGTTGSPPPNTEKMRLTGVGNLGIGTAAPTQKLEVNGGIRINTATVQPVCDASTRGTMWFIQQDPSTMQDDSMQVCIFTMAGDYAWRQLPLY